MEDCRDRKEYQRQHYLKNRERKLAYSKEYKENNKEAVLLKQRECNKKWFQNNKERVYKRRNEAYKNNPELKIREIIRKRLSKVIKGVHKNEGALELLGCSVEYFKEYISKQFKDGMSWENHSKTTWHIDHVKPCAKFDLTDPEQQKQCFHYTNMQPLWAKENHIKNAKYGKL